MEKTTIDLQRLNLIYDRFQIGSSSDVLTTSIEGLGTELNNRYLAIRNSQSLRQPIKDYITKIHALSQAINYMSKRFTDLLIRQQEINWMKQELAYETSPDVFAQASDPKAALWRSFMALAIKDFHIDMSSLMDSLAPVIIQAEGKLKSKDQSSLPGWPDIQNGTKRSYRTNLSDELQAVIDTADTWWVSIKKVRDLLTHRDHDKIIFGNSEDGLLFQVYDPKRRPQILLPMVIYRKSKNVVDFDLYSAFLFAQVILLLDDLGKIIATKMNISQDITSQNRLRMVDKNIAKSINNFVQVVVQQTTKSTRRST